MCPGEGEVGAENSRSNSHDAPRDKWNTPNDIRDELYSHQVDCEDRDATESGPETTLRLEETGRGSERASQERLSERGRISGFVGRIFVFGGDGFEEDGIAGRFDHEEGGEDTAVRVFDLAVVRRLLKLENGN